MEFGSAFKITDMSKNHKTKDPRSIRFLRVVDQLITDHKAAGIKPRSYNAIALLLGKDRNAIFRISSGDRKVSQTQMEKLAEEFNINHNAFYRDDCPVYYKQESSTTNPDLIKEKPNTSRVRRKTLVKTRSAYANSILLALDEAREIREDLSPNVRDEYERVLEDLNTISRELIEDYESLQMGYERIKQALIFKEESLKISQRFNRFLEGQNTNNKRLISLVEKLTED